MSYQMDINDLYTKVANGRGFVLRDSQKKLTAQMHDLLMRAGTQSDEDGDALDDAAVVGLFEAPTGVGKTFAFIASGVSAALAERRKLYISCSTITLQDQIGQNELEPFRIHSGVDFKYVVLKGRANYLCPHHLRDYLENEAPDLSYYEASLDAMAPAANPSANSPSRDSGQEGDDGLIQEARRQMEFYDSPNSENKYPEFPAELEPIRWQITSTPANCHANSCPYHKKRSCPFYNARHAVKDADVVVVNHYILMNDIKMGLGKVLPNIETSLVCIDEAHKLVDVAQTTMENAFDSRKMFDFLKNALENDTKLKLLQHLDGCSAVSSQDLLEHMKKCHQANKEVYKLLIEEMGKRETSPSYNSLSGRRWVWLNRDEFDSNFVNTINTFNLACRDAKDGMSNAKMNVEDTMASLDVELGSMMLVVRDKAIKLANNGVIAKVSAKLNAISRAQMDGGGADINLAFPGKGFDESLMIKSAEFMRNLQTVANGGFLTPGQLRSISKDFIKGAIPVIDEVCDSLGVDRFMDEFVKHLLEIRDKGLYRRKLDELLTMLSDLAEQLDGAFSASIRMVQRIRQIQNKDSSGSMGGRFVAGGVMRQFHADPPVALWVDCDMGSRDKNNLPKLEIHSVSTSHAPMLYEKFFSRVPAVAMTSATLTTMGSFEDFENEIGLGFYQNQSRIRTMVFDSPFDYSDVVFHKCSNMRFEPVGKDVAEHTKEVVRKIEGVVSGGKFPGTLALFTSKKQMNEVYNELSPAIRAKVLRQESNNKAELLKKHKERIDSGQESVIFGLESFSEGLDLVGKYCEQLIICKIPFPNNSDPVYQTTEDRIQVYDKYLPFNALMIPRAATKLKQYAGRLKRSEKDRGEIYLLDKRITTKKYGHKIMMGLPNYRFTEN